MPVANCRGVVQTGICVILKSFAAVHILSILVLIKISAALLLFIEKGKEWRANPGERNVTGLFKTKVGIESTLNLPWSITGFPYEIFHSN